jgi:hypothetical protein
VGIGVAGWVGETGELIELGLIDDIVMDFLPPPPVDLFPFAARDSVKQFVVSQS